MGMTYLRATSKPIVRLSGWPGSSQVLGRVYGERGRSRRDYAKEEAMKKTLLCLILIAPAAMAQQFSEWSTPVNVTQINSVANEQHPAISKDGLSLYFASGRPGGCGKMDIWV